MNTKLLNSMQLMMSIAGAEKLTAALIQRLKKLLDSHVYLTYRTRYAVNDYQHELNMEGQLDFYFSTPPDDRTVADIRAASEAWNKMELINRLIVLDAFSVLYADALADYSATEKTVLFCQIFINDFTGIIMAR